MACYFPAKYELALVFTSLKATIVLLYIFWSDSPIFYYTIYGAVDSLLFRVTYRAGDVGLS